MLRKLYELMESRLMAGFNGFRLVNSSLFQLA
jgi:hypothetical protein